MPEMYNPTTNSDQENLLFGGSTERWYTRLVTYKKPIIAAAVGTGLVILAVIVATVAVTSRSAVPTTPTPVITTTVPTPRTTKLTTTTPTTTTTSTTTTTTTTTTTPKSTTTDSTTTSTTTTEPTTSTTTTEPEPTTTSRTTPVDPQTTTTFHPTTLHPLPQNVTDFPPITLLYQMGMRPNFTEIQCLTHPFATFKFQVTVLETHTYIGEDQSRREDAKTSSARVANEALFDIKYPKPMPFPAKVPCNSTTLQTTN